jgi:hypothetical protein
MLNEALSKMGTLESSSGPLTKLPVLVLRLTLDVKPCLESIVSYRTRYFVSTVDCWFLYIFSLKVMDSR